MLGWMHAVHSLLIFGQPYFEVHQRKDAPSRTLGPRHRTLQDHDYYLSYESHVWSFEDPFPDWFRRAADELGRDRGAVAAEEYVVWRMHDVDDRLWDDADREERLHWQAIYAWFILHPATLERLAEVDLATGRIRRVVDQQEIWEACPQLVVAYRRLHRYVTVVLDRHHKLRSLVETMALSLTARFG